MTPYDLTSAAAHERVHDLRHEALASRLAARAACGRSARTPSAADRLRAALHLDRADDC
ncbi:MAG: hypothetical protein AB7O74_02380 [Candidatus Nanopelagicales bacterium]